MLHADKHALNALWKMEIEPLCRTCKNPRTVIRVNMCMYMHVCTHIYMCVYICVYICVYTHMHTLVCVYVFLKSDIT